MRNFLVPQSTQIDRVAGRPFFMVMASMSLVLSQRGPRRRRIASPRAHACADMDQERG